MVNAKRGQSLLVIILLISVVFTLVATASYRFTSETQTSKLQEESVRTLAAADSGIERGLQIASTVASTNQTYETAFGATAALAGINRTASRINITKTRATSYVTSTIDKDDQYIFYLYDYPNNNGAAASYFRDNFRIYYGALANTCGASRTLPAIEMTLIYGAGANTDKVARQVVDPCRDVAGSLKIAESQSGPPSAPQTVRVGVGCGASGCNVGGTLFNRYGDMSSLYIPQIIGTDYPKMLIVRVLFAPTIIGFQTTTPLNPFIQFFAQGQQIEAKAVSNNGVSKVVRLFKSNPQLPADLFVTTF